MHPLQQYVDAEMRARGWTQADLSRYSRGRLSTAYLSKMLKSRPRLSQMPDDRIIEALAETIGPSEEAIRRLAVQSMGIDLAPLHIVRSIEDASNDELLAELARRLSAVQRPRRGRPLGLAARSSKDKRPKED